MREVVDLKKALKQLNAQIAVLSAQGKGVNFQWKYYPRSGVKYLDLISVEPVVPLDKEEEQRLVSKTKTVLEPMELLNLNELKSTETAHEPTNGSGQAGSQTDCGKKDEAARTPSYHAGTDGEPADRGHAHLDGLGSEC